MKYFTVGPTEPHFSFREFLNEALKKDIPSLSHRSLEFAELFKTLAKNIKKLFRAPNNFEVVFLGSSTEFMERSIQNLSTKETLHFVNGAFAGRCAELAKLAGRKTTIIIGRIDGTFSLEDIPEKINPEIIFFVHNETSSGTKIPKKFFLEVMEKFPDSLFVCDVVSSAPVCDIPIKKLDLTYLSVQKSFGLPAGLGVGILSPRAIEAAKKIEVSKQNINIFHSFIEMSKDAKIGKTKETPNVLLIFLLNKVVENYLKIGVKKMQEETIVKSKLLVEALQKVKILNFPNIKSGWRSETVLVAETPKGSKDIVEKLKKMGFLIAAGYGREKDYKIRIANFPQHTETEVKKLIKNLLRL